METKKVAVSVLGMIDKMNARKIRNLREEIRQAREEIAEIKAGTRTLKKLLDELFKPPKPFKMQKTYIGLDGKRHRIPKGALSVSPPVPAIPAN
jgi:hypothetical protein